MTLPRFLGELLAYVALLGGLLFLCLLIEYGPPDLSSRPYPDPYWGPPTTDADPATTYTGPASRDAAKNRQ